MDKKPAVEPMVQTHLQIEHAPLIAPGLDFFDAAAVALGHAQFHKTKSIVGKTRIVQPHPVTAARLQIGKNLPFDKLDKDGF